MTTEWRDLPTMADVAAAQAAGEEIEVYMGIGRWDSWKGRTWDKSLGYRAHPRKQTKTIVLRRALYKNHSGHYILWCNGDWADNMSRGFIKWLPGEEIVEVEA